MTEIEGRILIVEDDRINALVLSKFLKTFTCDLAPDGNIALDLFSKNNYDIVLMDINLGDENLDGVEVQRRIRADYGGAGTPIIAVTAYAMPEDRERFLNAGFDEYLKKPVLPEVIVAKVKEMIQ